MARLALGLAVVAVALSAYTATRGPVASNGVEGDGATALEARLVAIEARLSEALAARPSPLPGREAPRAASDLAAPLASERPGVDPATLATRLAEVDKRLATIEEQAATAARDAESAPTVFSGRVGRALPFAPQGVVASLDDAEARFALSASQRGDWERAIEEGKRELEALQAIPDDDGKTWKQHQDEAMKSLESGNLDFGRLLAQRTRKVPGRDETYGEAEQRIRSKSKQRLRDTLSYDQQKKYDESYVDPLLGVGSGMSTAIRFTSIGEPRAPESR